MQLSTTRSIFRVHPLDAPVVALAADAGGTRVAAVKFHGANVIDRLPADASARALVEFCGDAPITGYRLAETLAALAARGAAPAGSSWELRELTELLLPALADASPEAVDVAVSVPSAQRGQVLAAAVDHACHVYGALVAHARAMPGGLLRRLAALARQAQSPLADLFAGLADVATTAGAVSGVDRRALAARLERPLPIGAPNTVPRPLDPEEISRLLSASGPFARRFPRFEARPEQLAMARAVADALGSAERQGEVRHLVVEGGTGIGKSVAYLLPSVLFALRNNARVVVSTNTISLQEQLMRKDIPHVLATLEGVPGIDISKFRVAQMKGKANYLCLRRWEALAAQDALSPDEARTLAKTLTWLQDTPTGDRAEVRLHGRELGVWDRMSANGFGTCPGAREGACFLRHARDEAAAAHLVIVNHALLLSDLVTQGGVLPEYDYLIVDEAHNLEEEATRQFGFHVAEGAVGELVDRLAGVVHGVAASARASGVEPQRMDPLQARLDEAQLALPRMRERWTDLMRGLVAFADEARSADRSEDGDLRVTTALRARPAWSELEIAWDSFNSATIEADTRARALLRGLDEFSNDSLDGVDALKGSVAEWSADTDELRKRVEGFVSKADEQMVYWLGHGGGPLTLNGAPLEVAPLLSAGLFAAKRSVVLTSATLAVRGEFAHIRGRLGVEDPAELCLGSPFDYKRAALLCLPTGLPELADRRHSQAIGEAIRDLAVLAGGRTLALFTSHAAVRATASALRAPLAARGIGVLAQGVDGTPQQLIARFQANPRAVLIGTASFWEGVDIGNGAVKVLVVGRLPFNVPTEPVFAARSEQYEQPFMQYAVPQAVLRFRQGFGRLIRSKNDHGVVVVLDGRITSKPYGRWFLASLPGPSVFTGPLAEVPRRVGEWLEHGRAT
ncbi:MAG: hypothetical protein FJ318_00050 [SAR202 cluster bacterium]|nr:hypothetical protein [SAR202 cluster bacterium]